MTIELKASDRSVGVFSSVTSIRAETWHFLSDTGSTRPGSDDIMFVDNELEHESDSHGWFVASTDTSSGAGFIPEGVIGHYKRLQVVERDFQTLKSTLDIRPMYHRTPHRIQAHVMICLMALQLSVSMDLRFVRLV